jgi:hypothetical protein
MWWWLAPLLVLVVAAAVVVLLTLNDGDDAASGRETGESAQDGGRGGQEVPAEEKVPRPKDRDAAAVAAALRELDPCKVLDLEVAKRRGKPNVVTIPTGPHSCFLAPGPDLSPGDAGGIEVRVGARSDVLLRYSGVPTVIGGAKAYEYAENTDSSSDCRVVIPVSAVLAVEVGYSELGDAGDLCPVVRQYAEGTVGKLRNPDAAAFTETTRPFSAWDGCLLLRTALGEAAAGTYTYEPNSHGDPLGGCVAHDNDADEMLSLEISYTDDALLTGAQNRQLAGKSVTLDDRGESCSARWDHGGNGNTNKWYAITPVYLLAQNCDKAAALAEKVITFAGQNPPAGTAPQRPLLFGPEENDTASLGACADLGTTGGEEDCQPYQQVPVPESPDDIVAAAEENRHVQCAVFADAIAGTFGKQFKPVAWGAHCFFVDTEHEVRIRVNVDAVNVPSDYGVGSLYTDRENTEIAGKAAVTFWDESRTAFEIYLSPSDDIGARGNLHIAVESMGGRGDLGSPEALPQEQADQGTEAMTQVVETYFR